MKIICVLFFILIFSARCVAGDVRLNIHKTDDLIIVSVVNTSDKVVKVSRLFTQNPAFGLIEFFAFSDGHRLSPLTAPNEDLPTASDYIDLAPLDTVGVAFYISEFRRKYRAGAHCFDLSVEYHDVVARKFNAYPETVDSNKIHICGSRSPE